MTIAEALELFRAGRPQEAARILSLWAKAHPSDAYGWFLLGACQHSLRQLELADESFALSSRLEPKNPESRLARITVLRERGHLSLAQDAARDALAQIPNNPRLHYAAALVADDAGQVVEALAGYERAVQLDPAFEDALHNRGILLLRLGLTGEAIENQQHSLRQFPRSARTSSLLVDCLITAGEFEPALRTLETHLSIHRGDSAASIQRGIALAGLRRYDDARREFNQAYEADAEGVRAFIRRIAPDADLRYALSPENLFVWQGWLALGRCDWSWWSLFASEMRHIPEAPEALVEPAAAFMACHLPLSGTERLAVATHIAKEVEVRVGTLPACPPRRPGRIRIGILSPDFREHLNAYLLLPLFQLLDRAHFELYAYSLARDDGSDIRAQLKSSAERFISLDAVGDEEAAVAVRNDDVDILLDVGGHTTGARFSITARRPARVQCSYLGFPGSLGSTRVDYAITDAIVGCDAREWKEELVELPDTYYLYDFRRTVPEIPVTRSEYGLPESAFVFCAFHKPEKISPDTFLLWTRILRLVPSSVLWLPALPEAARRNLLREAANHGIAPTRMIFAPFDSRDRYLARQGLGDLLLDAIHHSAMTTACDALAAGLPVLTIRGDAVASRAGESLVRAAGLPELVCRDRETFVAQAVALASDRSRLLAYRERLLRRAAPLFDTPGRVRALEVAFLEIWRRHGAPD